MRVRVPAVRMIGATMAFGLLAVASPARVSGVPDAAGDWPQFRNTIDHRGWNADERTISVDNVSQLVELWAGNLPGEIHGPTDSSPAVAGGFVYVASSNGTLYAYDLDGCGQPTCDAVWSGETGTPIYDSPAVADGTVFIGSHGGKVSAFAADGCGQTSCEPVWVGTTDGVLGFSSPAVADGVVYIGGDSLGLLTEARMYAFDAAGCGQPLCRPLWRTEPTLGHNAIESTAAVVSGVLYFYADDGYLYAYDSAGCGHPVCSPLWKAPTDIDYPISVSSPAVVGDTVYLGTGECFVNHCWLYAFPAKGCGQPECHAIWKGEMRGGVEASPAVAYDSVYVVDGSGFLSVFPVDGCGAKRCLPTWRGDFSVPGSFTSAAVANGVVFVQGGNFERQGAIVAYDALGCGAPDCDALWSTPIGLGSLSSPTVSHGMVISVSGDRLVHVFGLP